MINNKAETNELNQALYTNPAPTPTLLTLDQLGTLINTRGTVQYHEPLEDYEEDIIIVSSYFRPYTGTFLPILQVRGSQHQSFIIPLIGYIDIELKERICLICKTPISLQQSVPYCSLCLNSSLLYSLQCRFNGPGAPFQQECTPNNIPCQNLDGPRGCFDKHYVYVASIGNRLKVGTSSMKRKTSGKYARLIEQGVMQAITIESFPSLHEAMKAETKISQTLMLPQRLTIYDKALGLFEPEILLASPNSSYYKRLKQLFPTKKLQCIQVMEKPELPEYEEMFSQPGDTITPTSFLDPPPIEVLDPPPNHIQGEIIRTVGSLLVLYSDNHLQLLDSKRLIGRIIQPPEGEYPW